jgi:hypothetical protein
VSCGVVQAQAFGRVLFNQQVTTLALNDGGDGDTGFPTFVHLRIIFRVIPPKTKLEIRVTLRHSDKTSISKEVHKT